MTIPVPQVGAVIRFSYLWREEADLGRSEGVKERPTAIIAAFSVDQSDKKRVVILPITTRPPREADVAVEIPAATRRAIGLGQDPCWVICNHSNRFIWPGSDIRPVSAIPKRWILGMLPPGLFSKIINAFVRSGRAGKYRPVDRD